MSKETYSYVKRDLPIWQKRPTHMTKETYSYVKKKCDQHNRAGRMRGWQPHIWQKRPIIWQKRPTHMAKETYSYGKRD